MIPAPDGQQGSESVRAEVMGLKRTPRYLLLAVGYAALINAAFMASLLLRFEGDVPPRFWLGYSRMWLLYTGLSLLGYHFAGLFRGLWRYASTVTLYQILKGVTLSSLVLVLITLLSPDPLFPRSLIAMSWAWQLLMVGA